ncbi:MAG: hypothetical protein J6I40_01575 [Mailhella sp.]|nr:hypothetical protein [Mailhella sp.]
MRCRLLFFGLISSLLLSASFVWAGNVTKDGYFNGIRLAGKVKVVESFPDIKVQVVNSFPDIDVQVVNAFPDAVGKWQMVENFPDFTIQFVNSFPDIKVRFVNAFPGVK